MSVDGTIRHLKVKVKTLAAEAKIISKERRKLKGWTDFLSATSSKKHQKGKPKPEPRKTDKIPENAQVMYDEAMFERSSLWQHHKRHLAPEARATHLAYGCLRGVPYEKMEQGAYNFPDLSRVERMVLKFGEGGSNVLVPLFSDWKDQALKYYEEKGNLNPKAPVEVAA